MALSKTYMQEMLQGKNKNISTDYTDF